MELEFRLVQCTTVHFKCIIKTEVVIFLSFRKNIEIKRIPVQISKNLRAFVLFSKFATKHVKKSEKKTKGQRQVKGLWLLFGLKKITKKAKTYFWYNAT